MFDHAALHEHQAEHHRIVTDVLRYIAKEAGLPYPFVREDFISGEPELTGIVWDILHLNYPGRFVGVSWCYGCRRFNLDEYKH